MSICQERPVERLFNPSYGLTATDKASRNLIGPALYPSLLLQSYGSGDPFSRVYIAIDSDFSASFDTLEQNEAEHRGLQKYLRNLRHTAAEDISEAVIEEALRLWRYLRHSFACRLRTPHASTGPDRKILLFWRSELLYLEIEFVPNGSWSIFFEDMSDPKVFDAWDFEAHFGQNPSVEAMELIARFILPRSHPEAHVARLSR